MGIRKSLIGQGLRHIRFLHKQKNALKRERRKGKKMEGLLRTLTANRPLAEAVRFELTCP
ncbi:MAG: hypothetical protein K0S22_1015 [Oscillospiraceae bacterium]|nr:hypothetical protein [Oscillospiraceae bacterium]